MKCFRGALVASSWSCGLRGWTVGPDGILAKEKELGGLRPRAQAELSYRRREREEILGYLALDVCEFIIYHLLFIIYMQFTST